MKFLLKCYLHHRNVKFSDKKFRKILHNQFVIESFLPPVFCTYYDKYFYAVASKKITFIREKKSYWMYFRPDPSTSESCYKIGHSRYIKIPLGNLAPPPQGIRHRVYNQSEMSGAVKSRVSPNYLSEARCPVLSWNKLTNL